MIYTLQDTPVEIVADCGKHKIDRHQYKYQLVRVRSLEDADFVFYRFTYPNLLADGGPTEIEAAVKAAPKVKLVGHRLNCALREAH